MNEEERRLIQLFAELLLGGEFEKALESQGYWHHDEDFAAFMDVVLDPLSEEDMQ